MTGPGPQRATASYNFNGTSISVFVRIAANPSNMTTNISFAIDHQFVNSTLAAACARTPHARHHTRKHNLTGYIPRLFNLRGIPEFHSRQGGPLLVLGTSPYLAYSQEWSPGIVGLRPGLFESAVSLNNSVAGAADIGAPVAFSFTGTGFEVRGLLVSPFPSPIASHSLNDAAWTDVEMPINGIDSSNTVSNFEFMGDTMLVLVQEALNPNKRQTFNEVGTHSLVITPLIPCTFSLDYITIQSPTAFFPRKAAIAAPPSFNSSTSAGPSSTPVGASEKPNHTGLQAGPVAGIATCCVCLAISFLTWFLLHRRRRRRQIHGTNGARSAEDDARSAMPVEMTTAGIAAYTVLSAQLWSKLERQGSTRRENIGTTPQPPAYSEGVPHIA
ncbi:hypothetical protein DFH09DRAFT_1097234 [Mycena vulgaris]|nr:hypothetical protein DFH09DRAFT_1097234 [Mycena vulgaris]